LPAAIDRYLLPAERSAANPLAAVAVVDRRERQADGRTPDRYVDPGMRTALINITNYTVSTPEAALRLYVGWVKKTKLLILSEYVNKT